MSPADYAGSGTRERVHPQRTRFGAKATRSDERPQLLNFSSFAVVEINNDPGLWPVMHMPRRRRKLKNPSGLTRFILFYFISLRTHRVRLEIPTRDAKLIDEGVRGGQDCPAPTWFCRTRAVRRRVAQARASGKLRFEVGRVDPGGYLHFYSYQLCPGGPEQRC